MRAWLLIALLMQWPSYARNSVPVHLSPTWAIAIGILRVLAAGLVLLVADRTFLRHRSAEPASLWVVIATWLAAGLAAMAVQWAAFRYLGEPGISPLRWTVSSITFALRSALCAYYFGLREYWLQSVGELRTSSERLAELRASSRADLENIRARVRTIVVDQVLPRIRELQADLGDRRSEMTRDRMMRLSGIAEAYSQGIVRDASHEVSNLPAEGEPQHDYPGSSSAIASKSDVRRPLLISTRWTALVFMVTLVPLAFTAPPDDPVPPILFAIAVLLLMAWTGAWIQARIRGWSRSTIASTCWMTFTAVVGIEACVSANLLPARVITPVPRVSLMVIVFILLMLGASMERHLGGITDRAKALLQVRREMTNINAVLQEELASEKRRVALLLHGPVQGRLAAVSLLLKLDSGADGTGDARYDTRKRCQVILDQVVVDLASVVDGTFEEGQPLPERLAQLAARWQGLAAVSLTTDPQVLDHAAGDPRLRVWIFDIVEEGINNAVTHGHATGIDVDLTMNGGQVMVCVRDDGVGCSDDAAQGLGLSTIGRSPARLSITRTHTGGTLLTVSVPLTT
jgi:signal transduction histidine kinase